MTISQREDRLGPNPAEWIISEPRIEPDEKTDDDNEYDSVIDVPDDVPIVVHDAPPNEANEEGLSSYIGQRCGKSAVGLVLAFVSGLVFSANSYLVQSLKLDYTETMLVRSIVQVIVIGFLVCARGHSFWPTVGDHPLRTKVLMVIQGVLGSMMTICAFSCVLLMPLGDALTLIFSAPVSTMVVAAVILRHRLRLYKLSFGLVLLIGTVLVVRPPFLFGDASMEPVNVDSLNKTCPFDDCLLMSFYTDLYNVDERYIAQPHDHLYYIGVAIALSSAVVDGFLNVAINMCQEVPSIVLLWWTGFGGLLVSFVSFTFDADARIFSPQIVDISCTDWIIYILIGLGGIAAYFCMTKSLQMIDPTVVAFVRALEIVFAYVIQIAIVQQIPALLSIIGASLVLLSVFAMALHDKIMAMLPDKIKFLF